MSFDVFIEIAKEEEKYFQNYRYYAKLIKELAEKEVGNAEVYIFGSVVEKRHTPQSDIDILIISENAPEKNEDKAKVIGNILKEISVFAPFEIHLITPEQFELYKRFVKKMEKV